MVHKSKRKKWFGIVSHRRIRIIEREVDNKVKYMTVKYNILNEKIKKHIRESNVFGVGQNGNVMLHNKYCDAQTIVDQLVHDGVITIDELVKLLQ